MAEVEQVEIRNVRCVQETAKAIRVVGGDLEEDGVWVPLSVLSDDSEVYRFGTEGTLIIPEWFARKNGLA
jgi:hypothetical protein